MIAVTTFIDTAVQELIITAEREDSYQAFYMADSGINCMAYYGLGRDRAFQMRSDPETYYCDIDSEGQEFKFESGWSDHEENYTIYNEAEDSCYYDEENSEPDEEKWEPVFGLGLEEDKNQDPDNPDAVVIRSEYSEACAKVSVRVEPRVHFEDDENENVVRVRCRTEAVSRGASRCDEDGNPEEGAVERTRIRRLE